MSDTNASTLTLDRVEIVAVYSRLKPFEHTLKGCEATLLRRIEDYLYSSSSIEELEELERKGN